jgi:hypothetical protein
MGGKPHTQNLETGNWKLEELWENSSNWNYRNWVNWMYSKLDEKNSAKWGA